MVFFESMAKKEREPSNCNRFDISSLKDDVAILTFFNEDPVEQTQKLIALVALHKNHLEQLYFCLEKILSKR